MSGNDGLMTLSPAPHTHDFFEHLKNSHTRWPKTGAASPE